MWVYFLWISLCVSFSISIRLPEDGLTISEEAFTTSTPEVTSLKSNLHRQHCQNCGCGIRNEEPRVVGGLGSRPHAYPWLARLIYHKSFGCGASLINDRYVISAAHCVKGFTQVNNKNMTPDVQDCKKDAPHYGPEHYQAKMCKEEKEKRNITVVGTDYSYKHEMVWKNAIGFLILHLLALWGGFIVFTGGVSLNTLIWAYFVMLCATEGVTIGAHRLYTHKSFKAKSALKAVLILFQTIAGQNSMFVWAREHRLHHRYTDTDADPHNSKRGFFFCHIGWLMMKKHPYVIELGRKIDMSDLQADWMVMFQKKYYYYLYFPFAVFIPVWVPVYFFGETVWNSFLVAYVARYIYMLNGTWLVNSAAHLYGTRPYDRNLQPVESWFVSCLTLGEGWHNYHHAFPWDYKAAELSELFNYSADLIKFFETMGWAYDLKTASPEVVRNRIIRAGDGTHFELGTEEAKRAVTAIGPLHPLNPSYTVTYDPPVVTIKKEGLPLYHEKDILRDDTYL